jgi:hypothetical protein
MAAIALLAMSVIAASAQGGGGGRRGFGRMGGGLGLLGIPEVQKELKMTQPQIDKVPTKQQEVRSQMQDLFQNGGGQNASPEERQQMFAKVQGIQEKAVEDILTNDQLKRYHQLELQQQFQMMGPAALMRKDIAEKLKLTDDQRSKLGAIQEDVQSQMRDMFQNGGGQNASPEDRQQMMSKLQTIRKTANEKAIAVLTDDQQKQWKEMQGAPFTFPAFGQRRPPAGA